MKLLRKLGRWDARRMSRPINFLIVFLVLVGIIWMAWLSARLVDTVDDLQRTIHQVEHNRIKQCDDGNGLRKDIRGKVVRLAGDLGASDRTKALAGRRFTFKLTDCKNP